MTPGSTTTSSMISIRLRCVTGKRSAATVPANATKRLRAAGCCCRAEACAIEGAELLGDCFSRGSLSPLANGGPGCVSRVPNCLSSCRFCLRDVLDGVSCRSSTTTVSPSTPPSTRMSTLGRCYASSPCMRSLWKTCAVQQESCIERQTSVRGGRVGCVRADAEGHRPSN